VTVSVKLSFEDAVDANAIRRGLRGKMRQPAGDIQGPRDPEKIEEIKKTLNSDAALAQVVMNKIGDFLSERFDAKYSPRSKPKDEKRWIDKGDQRYHGDYSYTSDLACILLKFKQNQTKNILDQFCGDNPDSRELRQELKKLGVIIMDPTENRISHPDDTGLRNLATNLAVQITRANGTKTYHVCELQCLHEKYLPLYKVSHEHFKLMRKAQTDMRALETRILRYERELKTTGTGFRALQIMHKRLENAQGELATQTKIYNEHKELRVNANIEATRATGNPGIDAYLGYQPRIDGMSNNLAGLQGKKVNSSQLTAHIS